MQAPVHVPSHSMHNYETFASISSEDCELSLDEISQQTLAMSATMPHLLGQAAGGSAATSERLHEPRRIVPTSEAFGPSDLETFQAYQQRMAQMTQLAQMVAASQGIPAEAQADFWQRTLAEISKQCPGGEALAAAACAAAAAAVGGHPQTVPTTGWGGIWGQPPVPGEESADQRIQELNHYIRHQSQEYIEVQAEWSRQMAEARGEWSRELAKVRREKEEVERQARQELLRLQQRLREAGVEDSSIASAGPHGRGDSKNHVGNWAAGVSMDEYQQVHQKCSAAEDRVRELEKYIKDQSAKQLLSGDMALKDKNEEIRRLQQVIRTQGAELQQAKQELQASGKKVLIWEQASHRMAAAAEHFLSHGLWGPERSGDGEELENGRFGRTATKLSLTLSPGGETDVGSLQRMLKDVLRNGKEKSGKRAAPKSKEEGAATLETAPERPSPNEGDGRATLAVSSAGSVPTAASCDSNSSSRDTSPARALVQLSSQSGAAAGTPSGGASIQSARVVGFVSQIANELRQLVTMSQQSGLAFLSPSAAADEFPQSPSLGARRRAQQVLERVAAARRAVAQNIIGVEKMLRGLEKDLKQQCEDVLGTPESLSLLADGSDAAEWLSSAEEESRILVPLSEDHQRRTLTGLRLAQQRSTSALAEFVRLPQLLKSIFDATKQLQADLGTAVSPTVSPTAARPTHPDFTNAEYSPAMTPPKDIPEEGECEAPPPISGVPGEGNT